MGGYTEWGRIAVIAIVIAVTAPDLAAEKTRINGRVLDAGEKPAKDAEVYLVNPRPFEPFVVATANSDAGGKFEFSAELPVDFWANPFNCQVLVGGKGIGAAQVEVGKQCEIRLRPLTRITLTILDPDHKPVAGMKVYPSFFMSDSRERRFYMPPCPPVLSRLTGTTDAGGKVTFNNFPQACKFDIQFDDERFAYPGYAKRISTSENQGESAPVTLDLDPGAMVSGTVKYGPDGKGVGGIRVLVQPTSRNMMVGNSGSVRTDADGNYHIAHLMPAEYNAVLDLEPEIQKDWTAPAHEWLKLPAGLTTRGVDFSLIKGGIIKGKLITADTAEPLAGIMMGVHGPAHPQSGSMVGCALTNAEGEYSIHVPPGLQHVYIQGSLPEVYQQRGRDVRDINVDDGETVRLDFRLQRREGENVKGVVIGLDGKPAPGVLVLARSATGSFSGSSFRSDDQGRFHFDAIPLETQIEVKSGDIRTVEPAVVQRGQAELRLQLVPRVKRTLKGLITDENNKPLANAQIRLATWQGSMGLSEGNPLISDAEGRYELKDLYADTRYTLSVEAVGFGEKQAEIPVDSNQKEIPTLALPRADTTTSGVVVDEEGKPVAGVTVHLTSGTLQRTAVTDAQGRFSFQVVRGIRIAVSIPGKNPRVGVASPHATGVGGKTDLKIIIPKYEQ